MVKKRIKNKKNKEKQLNEIEKTINELKKDNSRKEEFKELKELINELKEDKKTVNVSEKEIKETRIVTRFFWLLFFIYGLINISLLFTVVIDILSVFKLEGVNFKKDFLILLIYFVTMTAVGFGVISFFKNRLFKDIKLKEKDFKILSLIISTIFLIGTSLYVTNGNTKEFSGNVSVYKYDKKEKDYKLFGTGRKSKEIKYIPVTKKIKDKDDKDIEVFSHYKTEDRYSIYAKAIKNPKKKIELTSEKGMKDYIITEESFSEIMALEYVILILLLGTLPPRFVMSLMFLNEED